MKIKEIIKQLANATPEEYPKVRSTMSDDVINFIKENLPSQYFLFQEKEDVYQSLLRFINEFKIK